MEARVALTELFSEIRGIRSMRANAVPRPLQQLSEEFATYPSTVESDACLALPPCPNVGRRFVAGDLLEIGEATAIESRRTWSESPWAPAGSRADDIVGKIKRRWRRGGRIPPGRHRSEPVKSFAHSRSTRSATSMCWWPAPATTIVASSRRNHHRRVRVAAAKSTSSVT